jgi:MscS family membrane protein
MVDTVLDNITERTHRKAECKLLLDQSTSKKSLLSVLNKIKSELEHQTQIESDFTVLFNNINAGSFEILISYLVKDVDAKTFNEIKQNINFSIVEIIQAESVFMAKPLDINTGNSSAKG